MINYIKGNLFDTTCNVIAHGCNAQGVMGSGVAKAVKENYYNAYVEYRNKYLKEGLKIGSVHFVKLDKKIIANCITQEFYGGNGIYINYQALTKCMWILHNECYKNNWTIAMPMIGAGLGGGDWSNIEKIIENEFVNIIPNVYML